MDNTLIKKIADQVGIPHHSVKNVLLLLADGATVPFIARYRKERTGNLDEVQIAHISDASDDIHKLIERRTFIIETIQEQGKLTPQLSKTISNIWDFNKLEDLYLPYKKKRKTKAVVAREQGLEPLALYIMDQKKPIVASLLSNYYNKDIKTQKDALEGARYIISERISEDSDLRSRLRENISKYGTIKSEVIKSKKKDAAIYQDYFDYNERINKIPSHRYLAISRGESEKLLRVKIVIDDPRILEEIERKYIITQSKTRNEVKLAIEDAYKRLIFPSVENQIRTEMKEKADTEAINVFTQNLSQLLLEAPLGQKNVLAIDPGFRTGCKIVALDRNGGLVASDVIYPNAPQNETEKSSYKINQWISRYQIEAIAIGNATASRETEIFVKDTITNSDVEVYIVNEKGASIYSASEVAREEFPDEDITVRGAVSIGRRLMDPLSELVKIDAKSIGVGQYQHDVNQTKLNNALDQTVINSVNSVGINLNIASKHVLAYVSGLGESLAQNIVDYRTEKGDFKNRKELLKVSRIGAKAYEQSAGFLRIRTGNEPLDNTGIHPESYTVAKKIIKDLGKPTKEILGQPNILETVNINSYVNDEIGIPTLKDIIGELKKPGLDPRGEAETFSFAAHLKSIDDIVLGDVLPGIVNNITNFGAFVDIGIKESGLLHISQITKKYISSPAEVLKLNQKLKVKVLDVDAHRKRISLTLLF